MPASDGYKQLLTT